MDASETNAQPKPSGPAWYQIQVDGTLDERWSDWFGDLAIETQGDVTTLTGPVADQAALRGMLSKMWDLNLTLISVTLVREE